MDLHFGTLDVRYPVSLYARLHVPPRRKRPTALVPASRCLRRFFLVVLHSTFILTYLNHRLDFLCFSDVSTVHSLCPPLRFQRNCIVVFPSDFFLQNVIRKIVLFCLPKAHRRSCMKLSRNLTGIDDYFQIPFQARNFEIA